MNLTPPPPSQNSSDKTVHSSGPKARSVGAGFFLTVLFCSSAVLDPRVGHTMDVLLRIVASPPRKNIRTLDTLWSIDSQNKIVNLMPPDVRF